MSLADKERGRDRDRRYRSCGISPSGRTRSDSRNYRNAGSSHDSGSMGVSTAARSGGNNGFSGGGGGRWRKSLASQQYDKEHLLCQHL